MACEHLDEDKEADGCGMNHHGLEVPMSTWIAVTTMGDEKEFLSTFGVNAAILQRLRLGRWRNARPKILVVSKGLALCNAGEHARDPFV